MGLDFETMSNVSEGSEKKTSLSSEKFEHSGFEPISSGSKIQSEAYDSDMFPKSLLDGYHRLVLSIKILKIGILEKHFLDKWNNMMSV